MADEEDYLDLVIAGELVTHWLEEIRSASRLERIKESVGKLREGVARSEAYIEEALEENGIEILKAFLKRANGEWESVLEDVQAILTKLEEYKQHHGMITSLKYGKYEIRIRQGALREGLGARIWNVSHLFNRFLVSQVPLLENKKILEIGSGVGSTGILTAIMAPTSTVVLSDGFLSVLENLRSSLHLNAPFLPDTELETFLDQINDEGRLENLCNEAGDLQIDEFLDNAEASWDVGNMKIRYLNWEASSSLHCETKKKDVPFDVEEGETFDIVLGCEVLYEMEHSEQIAKLLKSKICNNGLSWIAGAVREQNVFDAFEAHCKSLNLSVEKSRLEITKEDEIDVSEYEGGLVLYQIEHMEAPFRRH